MRCIFCKHPVFGEEGISVPGQGPAHLTCYQANQSMKRTFQSLDITALDDAELTNLLDLVLAEVNVRKKNDSDDDGIELF
ncbi:MAG: DUF2175 domain-containing protein [Gammaproteobacteria bacterium]|nr:DUF2175 domain-containing protein [Gammaproteobacteria bacterium]